MGFGEHLLRTPRLQVVWLDVSYYHAAAVPRWFRSDARLQAGVRDGDRRAGMPRICPFERVCHARAPTCL